MTPTMTLKLFKGLAGHLGNEGFVVEAASLNGWTRGKTEVLDPKRGAFWCHSYVVDGRNPAPVDMFIQYPIIYIIV